MILLLFLACDDEPKIDDNGCWLDGEEAYVAMTKLGCEVSTGCSPPLDSRLTVESCIEDNMDELAHRRENLCFDGCTVNRCLELLEAYGEQCTDEAQDAYYYCYEETFYDGLQKACVTRPW